MKRIIKYEDSLEVVRFKCENKQTDFDQKELVHLNLVWIELQESYGKKNVRPLDRSCGSCVITASKVIRNYIENDEPKTKSDTQEVKEWGSGNTYPIEAVEKLKDRPTEETPDDQLILAELRQKYPHIKARSTEKFLRLLNEE